jgi:hypothetical protein
MVKDGRRESLSLSRRAEAVKVAAIERRQLETRKDT